MPINDQPSAVLRVYVSATCATCATAYRRIAEVRRLRPRQAIEVVDLDEVEVVQPAYVFGTPTYCLGDRIISLGNPSLPALLAVLDAADAQEKTA